MAHTHISVLPQALSGVAFLYAVCPVRSVKAGGPPGSKVYRGARSRHSSLADGGPGTGSLCEQDT